MSDEVDFLHADKHKSLLLSLLLISLPTPQKWDEISRFLHVGKYQSFRQVDFNTLGIKEAYKVILSLLLGMIKHSQSTQGNKFAISLQYLKKEVRTGVHFLYADGQSFYKLGLLFLMEVARYVQSTQNRKLVIFLQRVLQLLLCSIVMQNIQIF